jgi:hypothetical protein
MSALSGMRVLKDARISSNLGGGKPNPFVVWAARLDVLLFPPPPPFADNDDLCCEKVTIVGIGLAAENPAAKSTADDRIRNINAKSDDFSFTMMSDVVGKLR